MKKTSKLVLFLAAFLFAGTLMAQTFPVQPSPPRIVNDYTNTLSPQELNALESKLVAFNDTASSQLAIVVINMIDDYAPGYDIGQFGFALAENWGVGQKGKNNGVLILAALSDRKVTIQVGYGLEGAVPDALARRIIESDIKPAFREQQYFRGLDEATNSLISLAAGEYNAEPRERSSGPAPWIILFAFVTMIGLMMVLRVNYVKKYARLNHVGFWVAWALLNEANRTHRGRWSNFSGGSGSGWGGGGGGGGFSGFGGGSFGGGGASGGW